MNLQYLKHCTPRCLFAIISLICLGLLGFGLYLQHVQGLEPCPMCIAQRYAFIVVAISSVLAMATSRKRLQITGATISLISAILGALVAARQSWLQWFPPDFASCGRDFYTALENFALSQLIPLVLQGSGDCIRVDWTFLGLSIANWSFLCFIALGTLSVAAWRRCRHPVA